MALSTYRLNAGQLPASFCFSTPQLLLAEFAKYLTVQVPDTESIFTIGSVVPSVERRTLPWFRIDGQGRPIGWFCFYNGGWRRTYNLPIGAIQLYTGSINDFSETGLGKVNTEVDGFALCNGENGTPDLRDRFIVGARSQASGIWKTNITDELTSAGGEAKHFITLDELPPRSSSAGAVNPLVSQYIKTDNAIGNAGRTTKVTEQEPQPLPPYYALAYTQFVGYA